MDDKPRRTVDGFTGRRVPPRAPRNQAAATTPQAVPQQPVSPHRLSFAAPPQLARRRRWWQNLLFPLAILVCLSASFVVQSLPLGIAAIAVYALVAWLRRIPSRVSFIMAFLALVTVVILLVVRQNVDLASNFSTYAFLLLVVAIASTMAESRVRPKKHQRSKIPHLRG